jgi:hypothetical protein
MDELTVTQADMDAAHACGCYYSEAFYQAFAAHRLTQITALENPTPEMVEDVAIALAEAEGEQWCADNANETLNGNSPADMRFSYRESAQTALTAAAAHLKGQV